MNFYTAPLSNLVKKDRHNATKRLLTLLAVVIVLVLSGCASAPDTTDQNLLTVQKGTLNVLSQPVQSKQIVTIGVYVSDIYGLNTTSNTFYLDGYLWLRWTGDTDPLKNLEFTNAVSEGRLVRKPLYEKPIVLPNGENYQVIRVQGDFFQPFNLSNYPLDSQELPIYLENSVYAAEDVSYVPDTKSSGYDTTVNMPGWNIIGFSTTQYQHDYATDFGTFGGPEASIYSTLKFGLHVHRKSNQFYWKLVFPLVIVLATCWMCLVISPEMVSMRFAMPPSTLLTMVFLHLASKQEIPQVSSLVLMDKIYLLAYVSIVATLALIIWDNAHLKQNDEGNLKRIMKIDLLSLAVELILLTGAVTYLIASVAR